jgi:hypothetical protein
MTASLERVCNVLTLFLAPCIIWARPCASRPDEGRAREASQMWGGERSCSRPRTPVGGRPLAALCWSKSKRLKVPRAKRHPGSSIPPYPSSRAARRTTLDRPHGSGLPSPEPTGAGSVTGDTTTTRSRHHILLVMAGIVPAISMRKSAALQAIEITGTRPVMTLRV